MSISVKELRGKLTAQRAQYLFRYDAETGILFNRIDRGQKAKAGHTVGHLDQSGYLKASIDGFPYYIHRLVWCLQFGEWPSLIDHVNGIKTDNRLANLRIATSSQNGMNVQKKRIASSGFVGVVKQYDGQFFARIKVGGKSHYLGRFKTAKAASLAYQEAAQELHGEFRANPDAAARRPAAEMAVFA